jgi:hypothetical protein
VETQEECSPSQARAGRCISGRDFLAQNIASDKDLAQEASWANVNATVVTLVDQIVAEIC